MLMVVVHGLGRGAAEWHAWAGEGAVVPDLPELRRTDAKPDTDAVIASLLGVLTSRGIERATWLGHSGGAHVVVELARRHPERVERLIVVAAAPRLEGVTSPVLVVLGGRDALRVEAKAGVAMQVIDEAGHDPHLETPARLREVIARWLATTRGSCHCGAVTIEVERAPTEVTSCNCSICRRLGTLWAYYATAEVRVAGTTATYRRGDKTIDFHHCPACGCTTHWSPLVGRDDRMGVNARLFAPDVVEAARVRRLDGASDDWKYLDD